MGRHWLPRGTTINSLERHYAGSHDEHSLRVLDNEQLAKRPLEARRGDARGPTLAVVGGVCEAAAEQMVGSVVAPPHHDNATPLNNRRIFLIK